MNFIQYALPIALFKAFFGIKLQFAVLAQVVKETMPVVFCVR